MQFFHIMQFVQQWFNRFRRAIFTAEMRHFCSYRKKMCQHHDAHTHISMHSRATDTHNSIQLSSSATAIAARELNSMESYIELKMLNNSNNNNKKTKQIAQYQRYIAKIYNAFFYIAHRMHVEQNANVIIISKMRHRFPLLQNNFLWAIKL